MKEENIIMIIKRLNKDDHEEKELSIEDMLDEADAEAKNNQERLSHDEVFKAIRSSLKDTTRSSLKDTTSNH